METAVTGIISHDLNGIVIGWDVGAEKIFGYSHVEMLGSRVARLIPLDLLEEKAETLQRLVRMERVAPFETRRLRKDGQSVSVLLAPSPVLDFTGKVVAITKVVCEVPKHRETDSALAKPLAESTNGSSTQHPEQDHSLKRELHDRVSTNPPVYEFPQAGPLLRLANLQVLLEVLPNGVMVVDEQGLIVIVNTGAVRMFGYGQECLLARPIEILFPGARGDPRWRDPARILESPLTVSVETGSDLTACRKDRSQFPAQVTLSSIRTLEGTFVLATVVDVTERKTTQEKLRESDARLREFAENLKDLLWISDPRVPKLIYASPAYERLWGRPLSALYADFSQGIESIHVDDRDRVRQNFFATVLEGRYDTEFRVVRPDGSMVWIHDRGFPSFDEHGEFVRVTGIAEDITERKQAEEALQRSEQKFRLMVECLPQLIWTCKPDGQCDFLNQQWSEYTGIPAAEQLGLNWLEQVHPDERAHLVQTWNTAVATGADFHSKFHIRRHDGTYRWFDTHAVPLRDPQGRILKWFGSNTDVQETHELHEALQKSESHFRQVVESVPIHFWTCDPSGQCDFLNRQCIEYTGIPAAEQMDFGWKKQIHPDDLTAIENAWDAAIATGSDFYTTYRFRRYDGVYRWFDVRAVPMRDSEGHIVKWFGTKIDIHEEHLLHEALRKYTARLKILADVSYAFSEAGMDFQETLRLMARKTVEALGDDCMVRLLSDDEKWLNLSGSYSIEPGTRELIRTIANTVPFQKDEPSLAGRVIREAQPLLIPAVDQEWLRTATMPVFGPLLDRLNVHSLIIAPLRLQGRVVGLLYVMRHRREWSAFDEDDLSLVQDLADRAALAVANARLYRKVQEELELRQQTEKSLRESEEYFRRLFDEAAVPATMVDLDGHILKANHAACRFFDIPEDVLLTYSFRDVTYSEDLVLTEEALASLLSGAADSYQIEKRYMRPQGDAVWAFVNCTMMRDTAGTPYRMIAQLQDITGRKRAEDTLRKSEERFRATFEQVAVGIAHVALDGQWLLANEKLCDILGYTHEELLRKRLESITHPDDVAADRASAQQLLANTRHSFSLEKRYIRKDGSPVWVNTTGSLVRKVGGEPPYFIVVIEDITRRRWAEEARRESEEAIQTLNAELEQRVQARTAELTALNKELEAFSYSVSHDLRAPLRNISGFIGLFTKSVGQQLAAGPQRYLTIITNEAKHMGELIDDLLAFSRIGRVGLQKTEVNLTRLVQEVWTGLELDVQGRDIVWQVGGLPQVYGDRALLRQVVVNLVANALKFTRTRAPAEIEIGIVPTPGVDQEVVVFVRDNGVGFDMQYSDKLFGVFQRLHRADEFEGTGVGLANVQRIIHRHGGRVWAEAAVDQGATFFVALPNP